MKFTILILALAVFCFTTATAQGSQAGGYQTIQWDPTNQQLVDVLNFGVDQAVPEAIAADLIPNGNWIWTQVNKVESQVVTGTNYIFNVDLSDGGALTIILTFVVNDIPWENSMTLISYNVIGAQ